MKEKCASDMTKKAGDKFAMFKKGRKGGKGDELKGGGKKKSLPPWLAKKGKD